MILRSTLQLSAATNNSQQHESITTLQIRQKGDLLDRRFPASHKHKCLFYSSTEMRLSPQSSEPSEMFTAGKTPRNTVNTGEKYGCWRSVQDAAPPS